VTAYRAFPELLTAVRDHPRVPAILRNANDTALARRFGIVLEEPLTPETLSKREAEVLRLVSRGFSNKQIARELFISVATVKVHVHHILEKLGAHTRTQAALAWSETQELTNA
jgi:DNA-binding NarL/FixJ family response regulator